MPQTNLFAPTMSRLTIEVSDGHLDLVSGILVTVRIAQGDGDLCTYWAKRLHGYEVDYFDSLVQAIAHAYMYGERPGDVMRAAAKVHKAARRHAAQHERRTGA